MASLIESFVTNYKREMDFYLEAARLCKLECESLLKENGIRAIVTYRAKSPERLEEKLGNRNAKAPYTSQDQIRDDIVDLAGVRAALYFPGDREQLEKLIPSAFVLLGEPKKFPEVVASRPNKKFSGYHATHYRVKLPADDLTEERIRYADAPIEIQVASVLMHAWAEVEHDLVYKPETGDLSEDEYAILDQLNGLVLSGETALELLQRAVRARVGSGKTSFANQYELAAFLFEQLKKSRSAAAPEEPIMGRVDRLFKLIRRADLNNPDALKIYLESLDPNTEKRPIADQIVDRLLAENTDLYQMWEDLAKAELDSSVRSPTATAEKQRLFGLFLSKWITLERFLDNVARKGAASGLSAINIPRTRFEELLKEEGLSDETVQRIRNLRSVRNRLIHGHRSPDEATLTAVIDDIESLFTLFETSTNRIKAAYKWARSTDGAPASQSA
jgi:ppGpp synthetase/RelA/SpoT-type nucleotidyltranferase/uncharacterized protein YutE (UPF0331/DUF86 family)